jgi:hypothetical protein
VDDLVVKQPPTPVVVTPKQPPIPAITPSAHLPLIFTSKATANEDADQPSIPATTPGAPLQRIPVTQPTVTEEAIRRHQESGIIVGRAKPYCCLDPKVRPHVRVIFNSKGSLMGYIFGKYAKRRVSKGDVQISLKHVDFNEEFEKVPAGEPRLKAIRHELQAKLAVQRQRATIAYAASPTPTMTSTPGPFEPESGAEVTIIDDSRHQRLREEGIIIGVAKPAFCRAPHKRAVVRAMLNSTKSVIAFVPGKYTKVGTGKRRSSNRLEYCRLWERFCWLGPMEDVQGDS